MENGVRVIDAVGRQIKRSVWVVSTGVDLVKGAALEYDYATGENNAKTPVAATAITHFAGVVATNTKMPATGESRQVIIYEPGSICEVLTDEATVVAGGFVVASYKAGTLGVFTDLDRSGAAGMSVATFIEAGVAGLVRAVLEKGAEYGGTAL